MRLPLRSVSRRRTPDDAIFQAVWNGTVLAESAGTVAVDGRRYFPPEDVRWQFLRPNDEESVCLWKGRAGYYDAEVAGRRGRSLAWTYPHPSPAAAQLEGRVAFTRAVKVRPVRDA